VGLTRRRQQNIAGVVTEAADDRHLRPPAPSAHDVLTSALRRSGSDGSATEAFRAGLAQATETNTVRPVPGEALRRVDALAGPDCSQEVNRLRQRVARQPDNTGSGQYVERLRDLLAAQQTRSDWFRAHPEVVSYLDDLVQRLRAGPTQPV
jgi:hypothetical protein